MPEADKILGLTAIIYAIVKNVVSPASISFLISTFLLEKIGNNFSFLVKVCIKNPPFDLYI